MNLPTTLPDPRQEAFAVSLAQGFPPDQAYNIAGFSAKNRKARAASLSRNKKIQARVEVLKACMPHMDDLKDRFAPTLRLMPETQEEMLAWLWQIMSGARGIRPLQFRAANLFCRLQGWRLPRRSPPESRVLRSSESAGASSNQNQSLDSISAPNPSHQSRAPEPPPPPTHLTNTHLIEAERTILACHNIETIAADRHLRAVTPAHTLSYYSTMADMALAAAAQNPIRAQIFQTGSVTASPSASPSAPSSDSPKTTANHCKPSPTTANFPTKSPSQTIVPQATEAPPSPPGDKNASRTTPSFILQLSPRLFRRHFLSFPPTVANTRQPDTRPDPASTLANRPLPRPLLKRMSLTSAR